MGTANRDADRLEQNLRKILPEARMKETPLEQCPGIRLLLLDPTNMDRPYSREEIQRLVENTPYWVFCWASGHALADYILRNNRMVAGKRVLDFGSGSGVVAIASARAGASEVIACDHDAHALEAVGANAERNSVHIRLCGSLSSAGSGVDLITAADVLYYGKNLAYLDRFLGIAPEVLLADSRVTSLEHPAYRRETEVTARTLPDLKEGEQYNRVRIYRGSVRLF